MRLRQRLIKLENVLPYKSNQEENGLDVIVSYLIENNEEFKECFKKFWRLRWKAEQNTYQWERWQEPYREQASVHIKRMNELIAGYLETCHVS